MSAADHQLRELTDELARAYDHYDNDLFSSQIYWKKEIDRINREMIKVYNENFYDGPSD